MKFRSFFVSIILLATVLISSSATLVGEEEGELENILFRDEYVYSEKVFNESDPYLLAPQFFGTSYLGCIGIEQIYCLLIDTSNANNSFLNLQIIQINSYPPKLILNLTTSFMTGNWGYYYTLEYFNFGFNSYHFGSSEYLELIYPHLFIGEQKIVVDNESIEGTEVDSISNKTGGVFRLNFLINKSFLNIQQISSFEIPPNYSPTVYSHSTEKPISSKFSLQNMVQYNGDNIYAHQCHSQKCVFNESISTEVDEINDLTFLSLTPMGINTVFSIRTEEYNSTLSKPIDIYFSQGGGIVFSFGSGSTYNRSGIHYTNYTIVHQQKAIQSLSCAQHCFMKVNSSLQVEWAYSLTDSGQYHWDYHAILEQNPSGDFLIRLERGMNHFLIKDLLTNITLQTSDQPYDENNYCNARFLLIEDNGSFGNSFCFRRGISGGGSGNERYDIIWKGELLSIGSHTSNPIYLREPINNSSDLRCHVALYDTSNYNNVTLLNESGCLGHYVPGKKSVIGPQNETYEFSIYTNLTYNDNEELVFYYVLEKDKPAVNFSQWLNYQPPVDENEDQTNNSGENNSNSNNTNSNNSGSEGNNSNNSNNSNNESGQNELENNTNQQDLDNNSSNSSQDNEGLNNSSNNNEKPSEGAEGDEILFSSQLKIYLTAGLLMFLVYLLTTTIYSNKFDK